MRNIKRIKRRKTSVVGAVLVAAVFGVAGGNNVASARENAGTPSPLAAASRWKTAEQSEKGNDGFWPRLGSNAVSTSEFNGNVDYAGERNADGKPSAATTGKDRVETANFIGYAGTLGLNERNGATNGRTRLVDWTTPDATSPVAPIGLAGGTGQNGETAGTVADGEKTEAAASGASDENASRAKTPILRDEPTETTRGGSLASALVSTFGALAVVLGAFFALVAFLKRTGPKIGGVGSALEIVDSLAVGDKARLLTIRWGNRLILAAKTPEKIAPLAEIADVEEASALLAEIERRKGAASTGDVGAKAAAIWKRGVDAASVWRTARETKGRRQ